MKQSSVSTILIVFWSLFAIFSILLIYGIRDVEVVADGSHWQGFRFILSLVVIPAVAGFVSFYHYLFPNFIQVRRFRAAAGIGLLLACGCSFLGYLALYFMMNFGWSCQVEGNYIGLFIMFFVGIITGICALIIKGFVTLFEEMKQKESLLNKNHEMQLALVKSKLDPHFLFNTINNIDVMMTKDPEIASIYLNQLSEIMRFMLFEARAEEIPMSKELTYIEKFIELQKIRTSNEHYVNYEVSGSPLNKKIAPMVFIPFIENAFKHTNNKKLIDAINVQIEIGKHQAKFTCKNKVDRSAKANWQSNGLGQDLIKKRLNLLYPERHELNISQQKNSYDVELTIQYD